MSETRHLAKSDLSLLQAEVLAHPPVKALPSNLSDDWLDLLERDLACYFRESEEDADCGSGLPAPLAVVLHLLLAKSNGKQASVAVDKLEEYLSMFRHELALEMISRRTDLKVSGASLKTILTKRRLVVSAQSAAA